MSFLDFDELVLAQAVVEARQTFSDRGWANHRRLPRVVDIKYKLGRDFEGDRVAWIWLIVPDSTTDRQLRGHALHDLSGVVIEALGKRTTEHLLDITPLFSFRRLREQRRLDSSGA